jgi:ATP-binding cassette, subfamily C, bacterial LapB
VSARLLERVRARWRTRGLQPTIGVRTVASLRLVAPHWQGRVTGPIRVLAPGRRVAMIGSHGSGKSSLLALLAGLREPDSGSALLGDVPMTALRQALPNRVALLSPDLMLPRGSVRECLLPASTAADDTALVRAIDLSGLAWLAPNCVADPDCLVHEGGRNLSHGQRRSLLLARALAGEPDVLLIDEPAACLPGEAAECLSRLIAGWPGMLIFASTDPSHAPLAHEVWRLEAGAVARCWMLPIQESAAAGQHLH